jgi:peptidoglycan hydrolase-like protein with peptidoglycan-binding domain
MRRLILTTASVIALGAGLTFAGVTPAAAWTHHSAMHGRMTHVSRAEVRDIQQKLKADNLYNGNIDGLMGPGTRHALAQFQKQNGLPVTANLDRQTRDSLLGTMGTATPPGSTQSTMGGTAMPPRSTHGITPGMTSGMTPPPSQGAAPTPSGGTSATGK